MRVIYQPGLLLLAILVTTITGCELRKPSQPDIALKPAFDPAGFQNGAIYKLQPGSSELKIYVYRGGILSHLGHNHIISTTDIQGNIYRHPQLEKSGIIMQLPVNSFEVDKPEHRQTAGEQFASTPTAKDIAGTRKNMLGAKLLDAMHYPQISIRSVSISGTKNKPDLLLRVTVKETPSDIMIPAQIEFKDDQIYIKGKTTLSQTSLGIIPFNILMGAIAVQDNLDIQFYLVASLSNESLSTQPRDFAKPNNIAFKNNAPTTIPPITYLK